MDITQLCVMLVLLITQPHTLHFSLFTPKCAHEHCDLVSSKVLLSPKSFSAQCTPRTLFSYSELSESDAQEVSKARSRLQLSNTGTRSRELFVARPELGGDKVQMYVCGVTVYDYSHIGEQGVGCEGSGDDDPSTGCFSSWFAENCGLS